MKPSVKRLGRSAAGCALILILASWTTSAQAQWAWKDAAGNITYSDAPPPSDVNPAAILRQPASAPDPGRDAHSGPGATYTTPSTEPRAADPPPAAAEQTRPAAPAAKTLAEQEADFRKRAADRDKAAQKAEQDEAKAAERAANCSQAQGYLQMIESGARLMRPDAEGNRNFMDEDQRAAEVQKTQETIAKNCS
jgi:hypothetical protein